MSPVTVADALASLPLTRLTHFTPALNLYHIVTEGKIRNSEDLADHAADYFTPTDPERKDRRRDMVCCNFEYPNPYYLAKARKKPEFANYPEWVCLLLDPQLILRPGTLFCGCNAARDWGKHARAGGQALLDCFAPVAKPMSEYSRKPGHHPGAPTDLQAEALVPGPIELSFLRGIVMISDVGVRQFYGVLDRQGLSPERFRWVVAPTFFDKNTLSNRIMCGAMISETTWTPSEDQESN
jgi:ssDNA thymidine ADP-ribosyltransferase, DarT